MTRKGIDFVIDGGMLLVAGIVILAASVACRGDEIEPRIILPMTPVLVEPDDPPKPEPAFEPKVIDRLTIEQIWVVESSVKLIVRQYPLRVLTIDQSKGPIRVRGKFADGTGKDENREYTAAYVYFITAETSGVVMLDLVPVGVMAEEDIVRQVLTVSGPRPPPDPGPGPDPEPNPTPTPVKHVSLAIVEDTMNRSPDTAILMNALVAWAEFVDGGNDWRAYDLTTNEAKGKKAITDLNGPSPGLVIYDKSNRQMIHRGALPATIDELKALVGRLTGG